jgi:hypothetical protein
MKIIATTLTGLVLATTGVVGVADAAQQRASIVIRHQTAGCHTWSVDGGPYRAAQSVSLVAGGQLTITDNDVMSHRLVRLSGPRAGYSLVDVGGRMGMMQAPYGAGMMPHPGARLRVTFATPGVYTFRTAAGEDYMKGIKTTGPDNVLRLVVTVR